MQVKLTALSGALLIAGLTSIAGCAPRLAERIPLRLLDQDLVHTDSLEQVTSLLFTDPADDSVLAYLRRPTRPPEGAGLPGIVLVAGRETGREAAEVIPGPLNGFVLAVEYPTAIPEGLSTRELMDRMPAIRRSAYRMPGILVGAAEFLASLPEVDPSRIALVGVSFGVPFAAPAGKDSIFQGVALHHGGAGLVRLFGANLPIGNSFLRGIAARYAASYFRLLEPARHVPEISPRPLLLINGAYDSLVPPESARRLAEAANPPVRQIWLPHDHLMPGDLAVMRELADSTIQHFPFLREAMARERPVRRDHH